ncbi:MAG: DUF4058 family protein [Anaerolineae bacterium]|nr:DUF4058 family protein [Anaerolineae bacterium]
MAIRARRNLFGGVNPHLHSRWQARRGWHQFHNVHITYTVVMMRAQLLPMGYTAQVEESLQVRRLDAAATPLAPRADILISDLRWRDPGTALLAEPTLPLEQLLDDIDTEHPYSAIALYRRDAPDEAPVAWIELLSPSNKGAAEDAQKYRAKRRALLQSGAVFVEIDYLHETPTTFASLGDYTSGSPEAKPWHIVVLDPRPDLRSGRGQPYGFVVDQPIPTVTIPLNAGDRLVFDFDAAYQKTYTEMAYGLEMVDYTLLPDSFERYNTLDQARIVARLTAIRAAMESGADLETADIMPAGLTLEEALRLAADWR